jgi:hypothetical protein
MADTALDPEDQRLRSNVVKRTLMGARSNYRIYASVSDLIRFRYPASAEAFARPRQTSINAPSRRLEHVIMTRFFLVLLERHRVVAPTSARPLAAPVPAL